MLENENASDKFVLDKSTCKLSIANGVLKIKRLEKKTKLFSNNKKTKKTIPINEIICAVCSETQSEITNEKNDTVITQSNSSNLSIFSIDRRKNHRWRMLELKLKSNSALACEKMKNEIETAISKHEEQLNARPKSLLVFINPFGGRGRAKLIYDTKVKPIFEIAKLQTEVIITDHKDHAREFIENSDNLPYDGIIAVGGDGSLNEIMNGLLFREQRKLGINLDSVNGDAQSCPAYATPDIRLGIIPAGSTDCVSYVTQGVNDAETSALHILVGDCHPMDVCSVRNKFGKLHHFSIAMTAYGFYGDVLKRSEQHRWLGPPRYDYAGVHAYLRNRSYPGEIRYIRSESEIHKSSSCRSPCSVCQDGWGDLPLSPTGKSSASLFLPTPGAERPQSMASSIDSWCRDDSEGITIHFKSDANTVAVTKKETISEIDGVEDLSSGDKTIEAAVEAIEDVKIESENADRESCTTGSTDEYIESTSDGSNPNTVNDHGDGLAVAKRPTHLGVVFAGSKNGEAEEKTVEKWETTTGNYTFINAIPMTCACEKCPQGISPNSHLADGCLDLIMVETCSRVQLIRYLVAHTGSGNRFDFPFVKAVRVKAFQFVPKPVEKVPSQDGDNKPNEKNGSNKFLKQIRRRRSMTDTHKKMENSPPKVRTRGQTMEDLSPTYARSQSVDNENLDTSVWNSDGEIIQDPEITVHVHRGLIKLFCRGVESVIQ